MVRISSGFVRNGTQIVIQHPEAVSKSKPKASGGQIVMRTSGLKGRSRQALLNQPRAIRTHLEARAAQQALNMQNRLQGALAAEYSKSGTGRFARGIRVGVKTQEVGGKSQTTLQIKALIYRETAFLTNLGGIGRFKEFPVEPYRIYAKGARNRADEFGPIGQKGSRVLARAIKTGGGVGRLKVPRSGNFIAAARQPGRGGGESRFLQSSGPQPAWAKTAFFYPLWVNHPGFRRDLLSELALQEGSTYQEDMIGGVKILVASGTISQSRIERVDSEYAMPIYLKRTR